MKLGEDISKLNYYKDAFKEQAKIRKIENMSYLDYIRKSNYSERTKKYARQIFITNTRNSSHD